VGYKTQIININQFPFGIIKRNYENITFYYCLYQHFFLSSWVVGKWKTIDDQSGEEKISGEIYEKSGFGKA
jgi:hypothetical protein